MLSKYNFCFCFFWIDFFGRRQHENQHFSKRQWKNNTVYKYKKVCTRRRKKWKNLYPKSQHLLLYIYMFARFMLQTLLLFKHCCCHHTIACSTHQFGDKTKTLESQSRCNYSEIIQLQMRYAEISAAHIPIYLES